MLDLFEKFLISTISCDSEAIAVGISDMINGDENQAVGYINGLNQLSYPLDCVQDMIDESTRRLSASYNKVVTAVQNA